MNWTLGNAGLLLALWLFPLACICAALITLIYALTKGGGLARTFRIIGAWFWSTGYGVDAFKAEQKLHFTRCMEQAGASLPGVAEVER